eukprot:189012-Chlamydomonas_euryale.AAC.1
MSPSHANLCERSSVGWEECWGAGGWEGHGPEAAPDGSVICWRSMCVGRRAGSGEDSVGCFCGRPV